MYYSNNLEYIIGNSYTANSYTSISYFSKNTDDNYFFERASPIMLETQYFRKNPFHNYGKVQQNYSMSYAVNHSFTPEIFLAPSRAKARFIDDNNEARRIAEETFELMINGKLPNNMSINILPLDEFKVLHSRFGSWNNGILGFSINGDNKRIFVRENNLDALMLVIGHEIGHVLTDTLPNEHDEEAKAFAFSIEWAKTIKKHNIANLGLSIKDEIDFQPAKNGLHDIALSFVNFMTKKGRNAVDVHRDLMKGYISVFDRIYF